MPPASLHSPHPEVFLSVPPDAVALTTDVQVIEVVVGGGVVVPPSDPPSAVIVTVAPEVIRDASTNRGPETAVGLV